MDTNARCLVFLIACVTGLPPFAVNAGASKLHCEPSVTAEVGDTVTLQCYTEPQRNVSQERIEWTRGNDEVHLRLKGEDDFTDQIPAYKNRTSLSDGLSKGNCSVTLLNVNETDSGTYRCSVRIKGTKEEECSTNLTVRPSGKKTFRNQHPAVGTTKKPGDSQTIIAVCVVVSFFVLRIFF